MVEMVRLIIDVYPGHYPYKSISIKMVEIGRFMYLPGHFPYRFISIKMVEMVRLKYPLAKSLRDLFL